MFYVPEALTHIISLNLYPPPIKAVFTIPQTQGAYVTFLGTLPGNQSHAICLHYPHSPYTILPAGGWYLGVWAHHSFPGSQEEFFLKSYYEKSSRSNTKLNFFLEKMKTQLKLSSTIKGTSSFTCGKPRGRPSHVG